MRVILALTALLLVISPSQISAAEETLTRFEQGNAAYSRNDYGQAIALYEQLLSEHGFAPGVLYNLGNSYARSGRIGKAILHYERALKLRPGDSDILGNLKLVRSEAGLFATQTSMIQRLASVLGLQQWLVLAALASIAIILLFALQHSLKLLRATHLSLVFILLATMAIAAAGAGFRYQEWQAYIVTEPDVRLRISPFENARASGEIREGTKVFPRKYHGVYVRVEDETGRNGWLARSSIESVLPPDR